MWIKVDPMYAGEESFVHPDHIERCDVNANPQPPWALLTLRSGATCTVSDKMAMQRLEKLLVTELTKPQ